MASSQPHLVNNGVAFSVSVDCVKRDCIVSAEALAGLAGREPGNNDLMQLFLAREANISGIARRMIAAGVPGAPLLLGVKNFGLS